MEKTIELDRLYELILTYKTSVEKNRDEINKYYTALFVAILSCVPFVDKITSSIDQISKHHNNRYVLILISLLGLVLSTSWKLTLQRIHHYLKGIDDLLIKIEENFPVSFISHMCNYLSDNDSPARVTQQELLIPYAFLVIFTVILLYFVSWFLF